MGIARSIFQRNSSHGHPKYENTDGATYQRDQIEEYRDEANSHRQQYHDLSRKAKNAYSKRRGEDAHTFSQQAHDHKDKMEDANKKAVDLLMERQQASIDNGELDLHGFYVSEAIDVLKSVLEKQDDDRSQLTVITGKGLHSTGGVAKIRPAVIGYLKKNNYRYTLSPGVVKVDVHSGAPGRRTRRAGCCVIS